MNLAIKPGSMRKTILIPSSKSYANRALILAALSEKDVILKNVPEASDVTHLISALTHIGLNIQSEENSLYVSGSFPECEKTGAHLSVGEGGTTARFLAVLLLKGEKEYQLKLGSRLKERPWEEFIHLARSLGAKAELLGDTLSLQGPIQGKEPIVVDCQRTTQFFTAFQLVYGSEREILPENLQSSQSYVKMTEEMIKAFQGKSSYEVPLDWSSASYPLAFCALNGGGEFPQLHYDPFQADSKFFQILNEQKLIEKTATGLRVLPLQKDFSLKLDASDCLDLVPTLAYYLAHVSGTHTLQGISNLVHKESDRLAECLKLLGIFKRSAREERGSLIIEGHGRKIDSPTNLDLPDDHRMVMTAALFLRHHAGGILSPAEAVEKSYPNFFELFDEVR